MNVPGTNEGNWRWRPRARRARPRARRTAARAHGGERAQRFGSEEAAVELDRLRGDRRPAELRRPPVRDRPRPKAAARTRSESSASIRSAIARAKRGRVDGLARAVVAGLEGDEQAGAAIGDDLGDPAGVRRDHGRLAGHRLEVDDPERLVDRRADEDARRGSGSGSPRGGRRARRARRPRRGTGAGDRSARRSRPRSRACRASLRRARAEPCGRAVRPRRADGMSPFWRVILPTNTTVGRSGSMPCDSRTSVAASGRYSLGVDAVVDHRDALGVDRRIAAQQVAAHLGGHRDDRVGALEAGALGEARDGVAAAELLRLPGPHRLEAVDGRDVRNAVRERGEVTAEVRVPGVAVDDAARGRSRRPSRGRPRAPRAPPGTARSPTAPPRACRRRRSACRAAAPAAPRPRRGRSARRVARVRGRGTRRARRRRRRPLADTRV